MGDFSNPPPPLAPPPPFAEFEFGVPSISPTMGAPFNLASPNFTHQQHPPQPPMMFDFEFPATGAGGGDSMDLSGFGAAAPPPTLLSSAEQTDLLGFLDQLEWEFDPALPKGLPEFPRMHAAEEESGNRSPHQSRNRNRNGLGLDIVSNVEPYRSDTRGEDGSTSHPDTTSMAPSDSSHAAVIALQPASSSHATDDDPSASFSQRPSKRRKSSLSDTASSQPSLSGTAAAAAAIAAAARKPLLSQPQKRLNHIMSEQRRRTAIKEGFITIEKLIAPDPAYRGPVPSLPSKRPGGGRAKALRGKGKMGSLFRASEFLGYLEEGVSALSIEVERLEAAVKANNHPMSGASLHGPSMMNYPMR